MNSRYLWIINLILQYSSCTWDMLRPIVNWKVLIIMSMIDVRVLFVNSQESQVVLCPTVQSACILRPAPICPGFIVSSQMAASHWGFRHVLHVVYVKKLWKSKEMYPCHLSNKPEPVPEYCSWNVQNWRILGILRQYYERWMGSWLKKWRGFGSASNKLYWRNKTIYKFHEN